MSLNESTGRKKVIITGAGIGGIATSIYLARQGYKVEVYEKNTFAGGRCGQIIREGHRFDLGATLLVMPTIYREVFNSMGLNFDEFLQLKPLNSTYKVYFGGDGELVFSSDNAFMKSQLEKIEPGSSKNFDLFISHGYRFFKESLVRLIGINFIRFGDFFTPGNIRLFLWLRIHLTQYQYVKRFFKNPFIIRAFTLQNIYLGQNPYKAPALFSMIPATECTEGAFFPPGGMYEIAGKLLRHAREMGVAFHFDATVKKVNVADKKVSSITLSDGSNITGDIFVINADLPYAYRKLLPANKKSRKLDRKKYACSALVFHWALKKKYDQLEHHTIVLSSEYEKGIKKIFFDKTLSDEPSFYVHSPVNTDPTAAPPGEDSISIVVPCGHLDRKKEQPWPELIKNTRKSVIERLVNLGMTGLEENIKFEICLTPADWEKTYNISRGSVFGSLSHTIFQMGYFRPHNRHRKYKNLYFTGGGTHPGNGVPLVLLSSKLVSERIYTENH